MIIDLKKCDQELPDTASEDAKQEEQCNQVICEEYNKLKAKDYKFQFTINFKKSHVSPDVYFPYIMQSCEVSAEVENNQLADYFKKNSESYKLLKWLGRK
jgi:hypothetical protein